MREASGIVRLRQIGRKAIAKRALTVTPSNSKVHGENTVADEGIL